MRATSDYFEDDPAFRFLWLKMLGGSAFLGALYVGVPVIIGTIIFKLSFDAEAFHYLLFPIIEYPDNTIVVLFLVLCESCLIGIISIMPFISFDDGIDGLDYSPKIGISSTIVICFLGVLSGILFIDIASEILRSIISGIIIMIIMGVLIRLLWEYLFDE